MTTPTYHVYVDFDCANFAGVHDFTTLHDDITADVKHFRISRGKDKDSNTYPAATMEMVLENSSGKYYPTATTGDYAGKVRLWLPVKVTAVYGGTTYPLYYGYINRITAYPIKNKQDIYFYCTDGIDLLTKTIVVQDMDDKTIMTDGAAVHQVLNAAGWLDVGISCTMQCIPTNTITKAGHGLVNDDIVIFLGASLPTELKSSTPYFVVRANVNDFGVALTRAGAYLTFALNGSGFFYQVRRRSIDVDGGDITNFPETFEFTKPV